MRVLHINAVYGAGSTGVIVRDLHELAREQGVESYVAYSTSPLSPCDIANGYRIGGTFGKKAHALLCRVNGMQAYFSRCATRRLLRYMDRVRPDVVHLHNLHSNFIHLNMLLRYLAERNIRTVLTLHDCWFYTGGCFHYTAAGCDRWLTGCGNCPKQRLDTPAYLSDRSAKILADRKRHFGAIKHLTVVGVSEWITDEARRTFFADADTATVYNGVDMEFYRPTPSNFRERYGLQNAFLLLGPASKWLASVNRETLLTVAAELREDERLLLIGCTEQQREHLPDRVIGLPYIRDRKELCAVYTAADVFVNCTREESLSLINVEAQACGTPVITYANTGVQETVDGESGLRVKTGDAAAFCAAIRRMREQPPREDDLREFVQRTFDRDRNYARYFDVYRKMQSV